MSRININMDSKFIWMFLVGYTVIVKGYQEFSSANCLTEGTVNCSQYIICTEDVDINVYPGRIKTLVYDIYIPRGLTQEASILVSSPPDMAVVISDVHLTYQDDSLTMTNGTYIPVITERTWMSLTEEANIVLPGCNVANRTLTATDIDTGKSFGLCKLLAFSRQGTYNFGEIDCNGSRVLRNSATEATIVPPRNASHSTDSTSIVTNENARESTLPTTATDSTSTVTNENARETTVPTIATDSNNSTDSMNSTDPTNSSYITTSPNTVNEDPCTYCLVKLAVAYLMADITDVSDNSTRVVTTTMASKNITIEVSTTLMLRIVQNTAVMSNFSTDIPDQVEFLHGYLNKFEIRMNLKSPLSAYKLALSSSDPILKIVSLRTLLIGENYEDIITTVTDQSICSGGSDTKVLDFGYLPNKGYYDSNASSLADIIVFEIILSMKDVVAVGDRFSIYIDMEVDSMEVMNSTKYFNVISATKFERVNITTTQSHKLLPKSGTGKIWLYWQVPPLSGGTNYISTSTRRYSGPGEDGLYVVGVEVGSIGSNMPCVSRSRHWKASSGLISYSNIGYTNGSAENQFTFIVHVLVLPDLAAASSSHELTVRIDYPGKGSPQYFKFYINVTDHEIFTAPDRNGNLPLNIYLNEQCRSITHSSDVEFILHTHFGRQYGRLIAVLPMPTGAMGQSFKLCNFGIVFKGHNIVGRFNTTTIRGGDEMIEKVFLDISPLTNVHFATYDKLTVNFVTMKLVTYIDQSIQINESTIPFIARLISNKKTVWTGELPMTKPSIEYYQNFIVLTAIVKIPDVNPQNLWYHYSQNGTYYHKEKIVWESGRNNYVFEFPKVIAYFYFSTTPCTVVCNVTTDWLPLKYYVTFVKDDNNVLLRKLPYALDQDLNTCFDLPLPGDSPSLMWVRITELSLFGVTSQKFEISITGDGIECARVGQKSLKVGTSGPAYNDQCSINSDITFCKLVSNITIATKTRCDVKCECDTPSQCSDVHVLMQSTNNDDWRMCELTINDV